MTDKFVMVEAVAIMSISSSLITRLSVQHRNKLEEYRNQPMSDQNALAERTNIIAQDANTGA